MIDLIAICDFLKPYHAYKNNQDHSDDETLSSDIVHRVKSQTAWWDYNKDEEMRVKRCKNAHDQFATCFWYL